MADILHRSGSGLLTFHCPGCGHAHQVRVNCFNNQADGCWGWNGSMESPTFTPSILTWCDISRCHSYVTDGKIQYLADCTHPLAGKTVPLPVWDC